MSKAICSWMLEDNSSRFLDQFESRFENLKQFISPITNNDKRSFESIISQVVTRSPNSPLPNFEDSFEYIRMYFNSGRYTGFKYYDKLHLIIFALEKKKKTHFKLFKPFSDDSLKKFQELITALSSLTKFPIHVVCLDNDSLKSLKRTQGLKDRLKNIKEFKYYIYDLSTMAGLKGKQWRNVRQKVNAFKKNNPKLKVEKLNIENYNDVIHFIGAWRSKLLSKRGLSYANLEKNKFAAKYYADKNDFSSIWAMVYKLRGRVVGFQFLYRLGDNAAAHAIGIADTTINGLSEFTQVHIWEEVYKTGIRFINDGASWRPGLDRYKRKFNPISVQNVFECKIDSK